MGRLFYKGLVGFLLSLFLAGQVHATLTIEITEGIEGAMPVAVVPFGRGEGLGSETLPVNIARVVSADLARSGRFAPLSEKDLVARPHEPQDVNLQNWRISGVDTLVIGKIRSDRAGHYVIHFRLYDVFKGEKLTEHVIPSTRGGLRRTAHFISDIIYEKLTGQRGAFATHIAYITASKKRSKMRYSLNIADADGYNEQTVLDSPSPLMSPSWSPDGRRIVYVSFEHGRPTINIQEVATGDRGVITRYNGLNGAPAWAPDGKSLALTLSKDGNPEIYILELASRKLHRITRNGGIDTEPAWSPDGRKLAFTSSRGGKPQIYIVKVDRNKAIGQPQRLTFEGNYNARAAFSPDGRLLTFVHAVRGAYRIAVLELKTGNMQELTDSYLDESPSFAPNGSMIIYATNVGDRGVLAAVSVDGRVRQRFAFQQGDVREPSWSPFGKKPFSSK